MPTIIKNGAVIEDSWQLLADENTEIPNQPTLVSIDVWNEQQDAIATKNGTVGIVIASSEMPDAIAGDLNQAPVIAIEFPVFADGRGFSIARLLRERFKYKGEVRAIGAPIRDQLNYLLRVGFDAFQLEDGEDLNAALSSFEDFSDNYQTSVKHPQPLFKRRHN